MTGIQYKSNGNEVLQRLTTFIDRQANDQILAAFTPPSVVMKDFQKKYPNAMLTEYPDPNERIRFWDTLYGERTRLEDDSIPAAYPSEFDQGLYGGLLGGDVRFLTQTTDGYVSSGWISSMIPPLLEDWSEFNQLHFDENHFWYDRFIKQLNIMVEEANGKFGISHLIVIDSLNFVYELVGATDTYMSLYDHPDMVHQAIDFGFDLNLKIHNTFFDIVETLDGGTCSWVVPWIPGRIVCESIDPFHMTSIDDFERWGREPVERFFSMYDGGVLHLHANGWHQLEAACTLKDLKAILMVNEKGYTPAMDMLGELRERAGDMPLSVMADYNTFMESLDKHSLCGGIFYYVSETPDIDSANRAMEKVRAYRV